MKNLECKFKKSFFEFLKNLLFYVRDCLSLTVFFKNASFILKITAYEKTVKKRLNLNYRHGRKIIDFSKIQIITLTS